MDGICRAPGCGKELMKGRKSCSLACSYILKRKIKPDIKCARPGCQNFASKTKKSRYCCPKCYSQHLIQLKSELVPPALLEGEKAIPLSQGQWAIVDEFDYEWLSKHNWVAVNVRNGESTPIYYAKNSKTCEYMHAAILGIKKGSGLEAIHGPGGTLYNVRKNLRIGTRRENQCDRVSSGKTSRYKGVSWNFRAKKWSVRVGHGDVYEFIGYFDDEIIAAEQYDVRCRGLHRSFGRFNFPLEFEQSAIRPEEDRICIECSGQFRGPSGLDYCSQDCLIDGSRDFRSCLQCSSTIPGFSKFCDDKCRVEYVRLCEEIPRPPIANTTYISLTLGKYAIVDNSDLAIVLSGGRKWHAKESNGVWYACRCSTPEEVDVYGSQVRMHRLLFGLHKDDTRHVGHCDGNGLNLRRSNIYITNNSDNYMNTRARADHGMKGVTGLSSGHFLAKIYHNGTYEYIGRYTSIEDAGRAYDARARIYHGENGRYNFPNEGERSAK